jgi:protocatechuate 3,4-dioxygenase beta subunit
MTLTRREVLARSLTAATGLALGLGSLRALGATLHADDVCTLTCTQTLGPCYYAANLVRSNITEGKSGLPTLLSFQVVDADTCQPISNASIDIWHTDAGGIYSAPINTMCNSADLTARTMTFCRGIQFTGSDGWAHFNTIFPGWYSGRTTHIHATVRVSGTEIVTTQFYFDDTLTTAIYSTHPNYANRPVKDTTNAGDSVIGGATSRVAPFLFTSKLILGKALVARKVIAIRSSRTSCAA